MILVFSMPFFKALIPKLISLWLIARLLQGDFKNNFLKDINKPLLYLIGSFYLFHVISLLYSSDKTAGLFDIEVKLSLIIFPFIIIASTDLIKRKFNVILKTFVLGNFAAALICLLYALYNSTGFDGNKLIFNAAVLDSKLSFFRSITQGGNYFFYKHLSVFMHPAYFSMYISLSLIIIFYFVKQNNFITRKSEKMFFYAISLFFLGFTYLLFSKAGIFVIILILISFFIYLLKQKENIFIKILFFILIALFIIVNFKYNDRINILIKEYKTTEFGLQNNKMTSDNDRFNIWLSSVEIIKNNVLLGVGNGDVEDELKNVYKKHNMQAAIDKSLNAHNQFLETFIALGIVGFMMLVTIIIIPLINAIKKRKILLLAFVVIIIINFMFESMLNTQAGVVFFAFFFSFLNFVSKE